MKSLAGTTKTSPTLEKAATGILGLDEITGGGFPRGRPTLICGGAGSGKTLLAMEFLVRGATQFNEPGVFMAFEENAKELTENVRSLGFDLSALVQRKKLLMDYVYVEPSEINVAGEFDLEGLFVRLNHAIDSIGAKRVVLDTIEALFGGLSNHNVLRPELRRLFRWLKDKGVTAVITGERGDGALTRQGLEEYVSDCVILLDHRVFDQMSTRRLRVVKYRGTTHGTNEYPFLIDEQGISVLPVTTLGLQHEALVERVSTGIPRLDAMLGGQGYYRGSSVLISGTAGTGKTSVATNLANAACKRGERCLYFAFEESPGQLIRNMKSIGLDLQQWVNKGLLKIEACRPTQHGLEMHLVTIHKEVKKFNPRIVIIDPISNFLLSGPPMEAQSMLMRLVDFLKDHQITALFTNMITGGPMDATDASITSLIDTWLFVRDIELGGERNRGLYVLKSRGMGHSNQIREFVMSDKGIDLKDVYVGTEGVLTGSYRMACEAREKAVTLLRKQEIGRHQRGLERKRKALEAQMTALRIEFEAEEDEVNQIIIQEQVQGERLLQDRSEMSLSRQADKATTPVTPSIKAKVPSSTSPHRSNGSRKAIKNEAQKN
jgi:circadian clock protein KaiC